MAGCADLENEDAFPGRKGRIHSGWHAKTNQGLLLRMNPELRQKPNARILNPRSEQDMMIYRLETTNRTVKH